MKLISESEIRKTVEASRPEVYYIPEGRILSPAARDYLNQQLIPIDVEKNRKAGELLRARIREEAGKEKSESRQFSPAGERRCAEAQGKAVQGKAVQGKAVQGKAPADCAGGAKPRYVDAQTGAVFADKPEYMTQISGNRLVCKDNPVIALRGKIDSTEAMVVFACCSVGENPKLQEDLSSVLDTLRRLMRCEVMDEPVGALKILGLDSDELRAQSHDPKKYYGVDLMAAPERPMGKNYAILNVLRTQVREAEVLAAAAFHGPDGFRRTDIIEALNRLSSALHIMMCRELSGYYQK